MTISPILDQPQSIDYAEMPGGPINRLANQELSCLLDAACDPQEIRWPWANQVYVRSIKMRVADWQEGELIPLVTRLFPGHQETIAGSEGVIITKRVAVPYKTNDDRAIVWLLECQAEGDRILRLEIDIDWGIALSQRIVDGLLVAQLNPEPARGLYQQSNAESTRIFGNPHGRPDYAELEDPTRARLIYHVLVNGIVEVPLILTVSDVGEQIAWSSFLSLREVEEIFDVSSRNWARRLQAGRLWTPEPAFNLAVEDARLEAIRHLQRHRTGTAPSDRRVEHIPSLIDAWDTLDPVQSRNLLAHLRRVAEANDGRLPEVLPAFPNESAHILKESLLSANTAYIRSLASHIQRHRTTAEFLEEHMPAVRLCADSLIWLRAEDAGMVDDRASRAALASCMLDAAQVALIAGSEVDAARWESEWRYLSGASASHPFDAQKSVFDLHAWVQTSTWMALPDRARGFADPWLGMRFAGAAIWQGVGLREQGGMIVVEPAWPQAWSWWALLGITLTEERRLSLLWDGSVLHSTRPVRSIHPVLVHKQIRLLHSDEFDFDPVFEMINEDAGESVVRTRFKPSFQLNP